MEMIWEYIILCSKNYHAEHDPIPGKWVMSAAWFRDLLATKCPCGHPLWTPGRDGYADTLYGLPYEICADAGAPELVEAGE